MILLLAAALAVDPLTPSADIVTEGVVSPGPDALTAVLTDLDRYRTAFPSDCVGLFKLGAPSAGQGATARVRYDMAAMHRALTMTISRIEILPGRTVVDFDHATDRGFVTRWVMEPVDTGTQVRIRTALNAPPWPFAAYYRKAVQPEWTDCQGRVLAGVAKAASGS
ncbi:MAG: hypothetical protein EXR71_05835 [Myxococcales bacterium]|nr:hypothetical protein [Myxococcales bacterium]